MKTANWGFLSTDLVEHVCLHTTDTGALVVTNWAAKDGQYVGDYLYSAGAPLWSGEHPSDIPQEST